jgi:hypothetical protein
MIKFCHSTACFKFSRGFGFLALETSSTLKKEFVKCFHHEHLIKIDPLQYCFPSVQPIGFQKFGSEKQYMGGR